MSNQIKFKNLLLLIVFPISNYAFAVDREAVCNIAIPDITNYVKWGRQLRNEIKKKCDVNQYDACLAKYTEEMQQKDSAEVLKMSQFFRDNKVEEYIKYYMLAGISLKYTGAALALRTDKSQEQIVADVYSSCITGKLN